MTTTRRTKITFEKHELMLISLPPDAKFFCSACDAELEHLAVARDVGSLVVLDRSDLRPEKSELINSTGTAEEKLRPLTRTIRRSPVTTSFPSFKDRWQRRLRPELVETACRVD